MGGTYSDAGDGAPNRAHAAIDRRAAQDDGGDRVKLHAEAGLRLPHGDARHADHAGKAGG